MVIGPTCRPETPYNPADRLFPIVRCGSCCAEVSGDNEDYRGKSAIAAWNRRAPLASQTAVEPVALYPASALVAAGNDAAALKARIAELEAGLEPFARKKLPSSKRAEISFNEHGLRCLMSPLEIAVTRARRLTEEKSNG